MAPPAPNAVEQMEHRLDALARLVDCISARGVEEGHQQGHVGPDGGVHPEESGGRVYGVVVRGRGVAGGD